MRVDLRMVARVWLFHTQVHLASLGAHTHVHVASLGAGADSRWPAAAPGQCGRPMVKPRMTSACTSASLDFQSMLKPPALATPAQSQGGLCSQGKSSLLLLGSEKAGL